MGKPSVVECMGGCVLMGRLVRRVLPVLVAAGAFAVVASAESASASPPASTATTAVVLAVPGSETVSSGQIHTCGVRTDGTVACWGDDTSGQASPPAGTFSQVSSGFAHTCGLKIDRTLTCWGDNSSGQASAPAGTFSQVSSGSFHTCAVRTDGTVACWGDNSLKQASPPAGTFSQVSSGGFHTCGVRTNGTLACWGYNHFGQANAPAGSFSQVSSGNSHTCGVGSDGTLACWGDNSSGQASPPSGTFSQVSSGGSHTCGVQTDQTLACWGYNFFGQASPPAGTFSQVSSGGFHTCGVQTDGTLACWGDNTYGQSTPPAGGFAPQADTTAPSIVTPANITVEATGPGGAVVTYVVSATDPDDAATVSCTPASGSTFLVGLTTVACTAADTNGNKSASSFTVTVTDTTAPSVTINVTSPVEASGPGGAAVSYTAAASDIVSGSLPPSCSPLSGSTFPLGSPIITCTATDAAGNVGTANATVVVQDTTAPSVTINVISPVEASGPGGATVVYTAAATDTVSGSLTPSCAPLSGSTFPIGSTPITCTATDAAGNTGSAGATVVVQDTKAPSVTINVTSPVEASGPSGATVVYTAAATDTVSGSLTPSCAPVSGSNFALSSTIITCTATDAAGNVGTATATVVVQDTTAPSVTIKVTSPVEASGPGGATVVYTSAATDAVSGSLTPSCSPLSGSTFALSSTIITCTAADAAGNVGTATATVVVQDTTAPSVTISVTSPVDATGPSGATVVYTAAASDTVSGSLTPTCAPLSGSTFAIGSTTVTCSATDAAGNTGTAKATVVVQDRTAPTLSLPAGITTTATSANGTVVTYEVSATDSDNPMSALAVSCSPPSGSTFVIGTTTVSCKATDPTGNVGTGSFQVTVTLVDFSMGPISPIKVVVGGTAATSVTVNSVGAFNSAVALSASGGRAGVSLTFSPSSVTPPAGGSASSTLTVRVSPFVTPTTFTLTVTGTADGRSHSTPASVTVIVSGSGISDVVGQMLVAGCMDQGIDNALNAKLSAAQAASSAGNIKTAINIVTAFIHQVRAQTGKHLMPGCSVDGVTFDPAAVLISDGHSLINSLAVSATPNPITGSVLTSDGSGVPGATLTLQDSTGTTLATATTDLTGFYFFATTGLLTPGDTYTVTVTLPTGFTGASPANQTFTWTASGELSLAGFTAT